MAQKWIGRARWRTAKALKVYELAEGRHADDARQLQTQIDTFVESLGDTTGNAQGRGELEENIASCWKEIAGWLGPLG